jgi:hypothetical protein
MPIDYEIDHSRRLVVGRGRGIVTDADVFGYQREVWSRPDVVGYDELVDMSAVTEIAIPTPAGGRFQMLATESASADAAEIPTKFAIVAGEAFAFGLGRMYQAYRELEPRSTKEVKVFRTLPDALAYLGIEGL